eukprot:1943111-Pleurochrysis_carterae.AAC.5
MRQLSFTLAAPAEAHSSSTTPPTSTPTCGGSARAHGSTRGPLSPHQRAQRGKSSIHPARGKSRAASRAESRVVFIFHIQALSNFLQNNSRESQIIPSGFLVLGRFSLRLTSFAGPGKYVQL